MASPPRDGYEIYFAEKLWELVPPYHRHEDGIATRPGVLRALVELFAAPAAIVRRSNDRLWEDVFIDLCDDWAVPYLGELVGTRLVSALNRRGRRVDVAKTIYYRRRKGTLRVLEELIADITGWEGTVVENFRRLARPRHGLDPHPAPLAGRFTVTPPGGWADLRNPHGSTLTDGPFDEYAHLADVRRQRGRDGRWGIPKLAFHLYRLRAFRVDGSAPFARAGDTTFTFDPSGRTIPLFMPRNRSDDYDAWRAARPWELPAPIHCRLLNHAEFVIGERLVQDLLGAGLAPLAAAELEALRGIRFPNEAHLARQINLLVNAALILPFYDQILAGALIDQCGKHALLPAAVHVDPPPGPAIAPEQTVAGDLSDWAAAPPGKSLVIDPDFGRFKLLGGPPVGPIRVTYHYGFSGEVGAGTYDRRQGLVEPPSATLPVGGGAVAAAAIPTAGALEVPGSTAYGPIADRNGITALTIQATNLERPYLRLAADWVLTAGVANATLTLDGLWISSPGPRTLELAGDWSKVSIRRTTLDPGGTDVDGGAIGPVTLDVAGTVDELVIESSITGPIRVTGTLDKLTVRDSIVHAIDPKVAAIALTPGEVHLERVTVLGSVDVERLWADATIITGAVDVTDTNDGCFRFSAAPAGSRLPHPFESYPLADDHALFVSKRFGDAGYAQLSEVAPVEIARGAESGSEMGAFSSLDNPIKADSLARKVDEYLPFGLIPIFLPATS